MILSQGIKAGKEKTLTCSLHVFVRQFNASQHKLITSFYLEIAVGVIEVKGLVVCSLASTKPVTIGITGRLIHDFQGTCATHAIFYFNGGIG